MAIHQDNEFTGIDVVLDGNEFRHCKFERCRLIYRGGELLTMSHCDFIGCQFMFDEAASRTVQFLKAIYHGMNGGQEVVEQVFATIRQPPHGVAGQHANEDVPSS